MVGDALRAEKFRVGKLDTADYAKSGRFPVIDQGQAPIAGYTDREDLLYDGPLPVVIFGDHTRALKFVDQRFVAGADGTKVLVPDTAKFDPLYFYFALSGLQVPSRGYNRHWALLRDMTVAWRPIDEQHRIARVLSTIQRAQQTYEKQYRSLENLLVSQRESEFDGVQLTAKLADVVQSVRYGTSEQCSDQGIGPLVLGITNIKEVDIDANGAKRLPYEPKSDYAGWLRDGDLLFVRTNANQRRIGRCSVYAGSPSPAVFASYLLRARVDQTLVNPWYLAHYAASPNGREALRASASGAADGKFNLNGPSLKHWSFPLPSLHLQAKTAERLEVTRRALAAAKLSLRSIDCVFSSALAELIGLQQ